jgi:hypothetical protein
MPSPLQWAGQALFYAAAGLLTAGFATWPTWRQHPVELAQIKISFAHGGARQVDCRKLTAEEIARLPPRERRPNDCARGRVPLRFELLLDDRSLFHSELRPTGVASDGPARVYEKVSVPAGRHTIEARLADSGRAEGWDWKSRVEVELQPLQNLSIDFAPDRGGFVVR